jgi:hypothetical protein
MAKPPNVTPDEFFEKHLRYEIMMLRETHAMLQPGATWGAVSEQQGAVIALSLMDAFAIHARALWEFFIGDTSVIAYTPQEFADESFTVDRKFMPKRLYMMLQNQVAHLGNLRTVDPDYMIDVGPRNEIRAAIEQELARFLPVLRDPYWTISRSDRQWSRIVSDTKGTA